MLNVIEKDGVHLLMSALACSYTESQPTGYTNLSVSQEFLNKYKSKMSAQTSKSAKAMLE